MPSQPKSPLAYAPLLALTLLLAAHAAPAAAAPALIPIEGVLTDDADVPLDGEPVELTLRLYDAAEGGELLYVEVTSVIPSAGYFSHPLGSEGQDELDLAIFRDHDEVFLGVTIGDDSEATPRMALGSVPFAAFAEHAGDARSVGGRGVDALQPRLVGMCGGNQAVQGYDSSGNAQCASFPRIGSCPAGEYMYGSDEAGMPLCRTDRVGPDGDITAVTPGAGLMGGGTTGEVTLSADTSVVQSRVAATCPGGQYMYGIQEDGSPMCRADDPGGDITAVTAGDGLSGGAGTGVATLSLATTPPVAAANVLTPVTVAKDAGWVEVVNATINAPTSGSVLVFANGQANSDTNCVLGVCEPEGIRARVGIATAVDEAPSFPFQHYTADEATGGSQVISMPVQALQTFPVVAGEHTFYLKMAADARHPDEGYRAVGSIQLIFLPGAGP